MDCPETRISSCLQAALDEEEEDVLDEEDRVLARMDQGLYPLQQCALLVGNLWRSGDKGVRKRILLLLHQKVTTLSVSLSDLPLTL